MKNIIKIMNATFYAYHGAMKEEHKIGGKFNVDVEMYTDFSQAAADDDLTKTIDYQLVYDEINNVIHENRFFLIETISTIITDRLLENHPQIEKLIVRVRKNTVPIGGLIDYVEAEVIKENGK